MNDNTRQAAEADPTPDGGERQQGEKKKGQAPLPRRLEYHKHRTRQKRGQENVAPTSLQSRTDYQRKVQSHPEAKPDRSEEPNCSNSFNRDQIKDLDPLG